MENNAMVQVVDRRRSELSAAEFPDAWIRQHLTEERKLASRLGEIREVIFGAQDGLVSTLAVVSTVGGATFDRFPILVAGIASGLAGVFSMAAGEYMSSRSQREIFDAQIIDEREEVADRPGEAQAEVAYMFAEEGLPRDDASKIAEILARHPDVLLKTMIEKELGLTDEAEGSPLQGALIMGAAFGIGAAVPIIPYVFLSVAAAVPVSIVATGAVLFAIGVAKSRWTQRNPIASGLEILLLAAFAGIAGYFFGNVLPGILDVATLA